MRPLLSVCGPTASGKSDLAHQLSQGRPLINADSRQIYQALSIGTAKPLASEYSGSSYFLLDFLSPHRRYDGYQFMSSVERIYQQCRQRPLLVGGTPFYLNLLQEGLPPSTQIDASVRAQIAELYESEGLPGLQAFLNQKDPEYYTEVDKTNPGRLMRALEYCLSSGEPFSAFRKRRSATGFQNLFVVLVWPRAVLRERIARRCEQMFQSGWVDEVRSLVEMGYSGQTAALNSLGYREILQYLEGRMSLEESKQIIINKTRQFAKRQMTWFKRFSPALFIYYGDTIRQKEDIWLNDIATFSEDDYDALSRGGLNAKFRLFWEEGKTQALLNKIIRGFYAN